MQHAANMNASAREGVPGASVPRTLVRCSVLIADDEDDVLELLGRYLTLAGCEVVKARTGEEALARCTALLPSLVVLDIGMPQMDGIEVCKQLKASPSTAAIPIIMLTARVTEVDRVLCFELGVDDYVTKPFSPRELVLRINGILRRRTSQPGDPPVLVAGAISLEASRATVRCEGRLLTLTPLEFRLLQTLMEGAGRTFTRESLLNAVWHGEPDVGARAIDTHIRRLREKLGTAGKQIVTVRSFGYRLDEE